MLLGLLILAGILGTIVGIIYSVWYYMAGRDAASYGYKSYNNTHSGYAAWLYDTGYDSIEAGEERAKRNLEARRKRREARG